jgi:hypothetical protein
LYFYIDESGHTGNNLFDENQPYLYYGVLSSTENIDVIASTELEDVRSKLGVDRLHASELGNGKLVSIVQDILALEKKYQLRFDINRVAKVDHAMISFFDQVFDQGVNPSVPWLSYWTPLRYVLLVKLAPLFDDDLLKDAWKARIELNRKKSNLLLVKVCETLLLRVPNVADARSREIMTDTLTYVIRNPDAIVYNVNTPRDRLQIAPNLIGFQSVMFGIAKRLKECGSEASKIIVDQQSQFNGAQKKLSEFYATNNNLYSEMGPGLPEADFTGMPETPIECISGTKSIGLELVDIYLWVFKRAMEEKTLATELYELINSQSEIGEIDEVSINAIINRWTPWLENLPEPSASDLKEGRRVREIDEIRRKKFLNGSA